MDSPRKRRVVKLFVLVLPMFLVVLAGMVWVVSALWNWLMPTIFAVRAITYWQALGLMVLSWILFRGFRGPRFSHGPWRHAGMRERWGKMTLDEREEFFKGLRSRWSGPPPEPGAKA